MGIRELRTDHEPVFCEICGRSLLQGEHAVVFSDGRVLHQVCDLCTARAQRHGWVRDGSAEVSTPAAHAERARSLVGRLRPRRDDHEVAPREPHTPNEPRDPRREGAPAPVEVDSHAQVSQAFRVFNASEHARTVAGVIRSLGAPYIHAGSPQSDTVVEVLVVWELCWYRYEVDLEDGRVRLCGQGYEPAELGAELPAANAITDARGKLTIAPHS